MLDSTKKNIRKSQEQVWDKIAKKWAEFRTEISPTVKTFLEESKGKVLDIGCGSGRNFMKLKNIDFFATDFSKKMLELAKERANKLDMKLILEKQILQNFHLKIIFLIEYYAMLFCIALNLKKKEKEQLKKYLEF